MGMYTTLKGTLVFKTEEIAEAFCESWEDVAKLEPKVAHFITYSRSGFIPNSGKGVSMLEGKIVQFECELKNYSNTIDVFIDLVPSLCDDWMLISRYEESSYECLYTPKLYQKGVNGDNSWIRWPGDRKEEYPNFDVFDFTNLEK